MKVHELFETAHDVRSLMGEIPDYHMGNFSINGLDIKSLKGCPSKVTQNFYCSSNDLMDLEGGPKEVMENYICEDSNLYSLKGIAEEIGTSLFLARNNLTSLHNIHKQIKHIGDSADFTRNPITNCVLGLLLIDGLEHVALGDRYDEDLELNKVQMIINKYLEGDKDVFACQEELIEAGFEEFAKL